MSWLQKEVSLYCSQTDNVGRKCTLGNILFSEFHKNWGDLYELKNLDAGATDYKERKNALKSKLMAFTPAALLENRKTVLQATGLMQLDFDNVAEYDIEELKQAIFKLPFVAFAGRSCSGNALYVLVNIADVARLPEAAEHCFKTFESYGIKCDTSKARNFNDMRFVSYDCNMLIRDEPDALHVPVKKPIPVKRSKVPASDDFNAFEYAFKKVEQKYGSFTPGNRHNFLFTLCCTLRGLNIQRQDAEQWIYENLIQQSEIRTNCIKKGFSY